MRSASLLAVTLASSSRHQGELMIVERRCRHLRPAGEVAHGRFKVAARDRVVRRVTVRYALNADRAASFEFLAEK